jgi:hypothetical protein
VGVSLGLGDLSDNQVNTSIVCKSVQIGADGRDSSAPAAHGRILWMDTPIFTDAPCGLVDTFFLAAESCGSALRRVSTGTSRRVTRLRADQSLLMWQSYGGSPNLAGVTIAGGVRSYRKRILKRLLRPTELMRDLRLSIRPFLAGTASQRRLRH